MLLMNCYLRLEMKINSLELSWFRGAPERASIDARGRSCVIYGDTASGKSSFVDGFEYLLNRGRIEHVSCEYADRSGQRNCVRNTATQMMLMLKQRLILLVESLYTQ